MRILSATNTGKGTAPVSANSNSGIEMEERMRNPKVTGSIFMRGVIV